MPATETHRGWTTVLADLPLAVKMTAGLLAVALAAFLGLAELGG